MHLVHVPVTGPHNHELGSSEVASSAAMSPLTACMCSCARAALPHICLTMAAVNATGEASSAGRGTFLSVSCVHLGVSSTEGALYVLRSVQLTCS